MNTREENVEALMREAEEIAEHQARRRAELDWARRWEAGDARCPRCKGTDFVCGEVKHESLIRYETYVCNQESCQTCWKLELRETALTIVEGGDEREWIDLRPHDASREVALTERERATTVAALCYWRREGLMSSGHEIDLASDHGRLDALTEGEIEQLCLRLSAAEGEEPGAYTTRGRQIPGPQQFKIVIEDGVVIGVRALGTAAACGAQPLFTVREYESDDSLDEDHRTGVDEDDRAYYEHEVPVWDEPGATGPDAELDDTVNVDLWKLHWEDISTGDEPPRRRDVPRT